MSHCSWPESFFFLFFDIEMGVSLCCPNSWLQAILPPRPAKALELQTRDTMPGLRWSPKSTLEPYLDPAMPEVKLTLPQTVLFCDRVSLGLPRLECLTAALTSQAQVILSPQPLE